MSSDTKIVKMDVVTQGWVRPHTAIEYRRGHDVMAVLVDLHTKRGEVTFDGSDEHGVPEIGLLPTEDSVGVDASDMDKLTVIRFPELKGWTLFCSDLCKYSLHLCFINT